MSGVDAQFTFIFSVHIYLCSILTNVFGCVNSHFSPPSSRPANGTFRCTNRIVFPSRQRRRTRHSSGFEESDRSSRYQRPPTQVVLIPFPRSGPFFIFARLQDACTSRVTQDTRNGSFRTPGILRLARNPKLESSQSSVHFDLVRLPLRLTDRPTDLFSSLRRGSTFPFIF